MAAHHLCQKSDPDQQSSDECAAKYSLPAMTLGPGIYDSIMKPIKTNYKVPRDQEYGVLLQQPQLPVPESPRITKRTVTPTRALEPELVATARSLQKMRQPRVVLHRDKNLDRMAEDLTFLQTSITDMYHQLEGIEQAVLCCGTYSTNLKNSS